MRKTASLLAMGILAVVFLAACGGASEGNTSSGNSAVEPVVVPVPTTVKTLVEIDTVTGQIDITPALSGGNLLSLVVSNPTETVLDASSQVIIGYRLAWNDTDSWYPAGGKVTALLLPKTTLVGAAKSLGAGAGMPYLVRPDGSFISFNTSPETCSFTLNGVPIAVNADGLVHY